MSVAEKPRNRRVWQCLVYHLDRVPEGQGTPSRMESDRSAKNRGLGRSMKAFGQKSQPGGQCPAHRAAASSAACFHQWINGLLERPRFGDRNLRN
jgi:hypothetical protein